MTSAPAGIARNTPPVVSLGRRARRAFLVTHIVSAGAWIGIDVVVGVLVVASLMTDEVQTQAVTYQALGMFAVWPMLASGLACLTTGLILGLGTKHGLIRFWWVFVKLCLNVVLTILIMFALRPDITALADRGRATLSGDTTELVASAQLLFPPAVSLTALSIAVILSVFKPWGRIGSGRRDVRRAE